MNLNEAKALAAHPVNEAIASADIAEAILIRQVEEKFLEIFSQGRMNGTVHTCVGQEFSAVAIAGQLSSEDWITSNHRCHGHFISKTKDWKGLIDELMGLESGVCKGIGSSQHLFAPGFLSNGPQAALVPVATGIALHKKISKEEGIAVSFIGEGTLGEGVLYEAMNLAALYEVPHLIVCENNFYSQSTPQETGVAGAIVDRPRAFGLKVFEANTWELANLSAVAREAIAYVRTGRPAFMVVSTYRLNAHSKGDDDRDPQEIEFFREHDRLTQLLSETQWASLKAQVTEEIDQHVSSRTRQVLDIARYAKDQLPRSQTLLMESQTNKNIRMVQALNGAYRKKLNDGAFFIGEDIVDPYGGAFKVTKGLSTDFPDRVRSSPISESGIVGVAIGMSLMGSEAFVEIMFGDFMTLTFDQILNNASKFHHMYAFQASAPLRVRTPMGGKRGYGPTHSQSLEKFFVGIDNTAVIALSSLVDPEIVIDATKTVACPMILLENKIDYGKYLWQDTSYYKLTVERKNFGSAKLTPVLSKPTITLVSYGETARHLADNLEQFFERTDYVPELIALTQLHPLDIALIERSVALTGAILIVEDGSVDFGIGAEILGRLMEKHVMLKFALRVGAEAVPIPSVMELELALLPTIDRVIMKFFEKLGGRENA